VTVEHPTLVEIQYFNPTTTSWETGHNAINLLRPAVYVQKLALRGMVARAIEKDTGIIVYADGGDLL
jgi:hypothetical protein